jgi:hypothetical protein
MGKSKKICFGDESSTNQQVLIRSPVSRSAPVPPFSESSPPFPSSVSLPLTPCSMSFAGPPTSRLFRALPVRFFPNCTVIKTNSCSIAISPDATPKTTLPSRKWMTEPTAKKNNPVAKRLVRCLLELHRANCRQLDGESQTSRIPTTAPTLPDNSNAKSSFDI